MEIYVTGEDFMPYDIVDQFESCIWTDRYSSFGDFKLRVKKVDQLTGSLHSTPRFLLNSEAQSIMMVENIETKSQEGGERVFEVSGRSIEAFLMERTNTAPGGNKAIPFHDTPGNIIMHMMDKYVLNPDNSDNALLNIVPSAYIPAHELVSRYVDRGNMYDVIKELCDDYGYGFAFMRGFYNGVPDVSFNILNGIDRTDPSLSYYMEYSQDLETLTDVSTLRSIQGYKNHARVEGETIVRDVYYKGEGFALHSFRRRTMVVNASSVKVDEETSYEDVLKILDMMGRAALYNQRPVNLIDGDIPQAAWNDIYYGLGDLVVVKDGLGTRQKARITEQIWSQDQTGFKRTPTFEVLENQ